jgi:hypothetical protein
MRTRLAAALALFLSPVIAAAQTASDSTPRPGSWGAEVFIRDGGTGASLLRFGSSSRALVLGAEFNFQNTDTEVGTVGAGSDGSSSNLALRLGMRSYRQSSTEQLRPVIGFGARGAYGNGPSDFTNWSAGVYGELGAVYFLTPHVSLGGTGEINASYGKRTQTLSSGVEIDQSTTAFGGSLMRVMLSVYF